MFKKLTGIALCAAAFGGALGSSVESASAGGSFYTNGGFGATNANNDWQVPFGNTLRVRTTHVSSVTAQSNSVFPSTAGLPYNVHLAWSCTQSSNATARSVVAGPNSTVSGRCSLGTLTQSFTAFDYPYL